MMQLSRFLSRYWQPLLMGAWFYALAGLLPGRAYTAFLRPEFGILLVVALLVLIGFLFAEMASVGRKRAFGIDGAIRMLILIAPLVYLSIARGASLDSSAFQRRWTGMAGINGRSMPLQDAVMDGGTKDVSGSNEDVPLHYLCRHPKAYAERTIAVVGMLHRDPNIAARFGTNTCVMFRFVITCCAADAMPAAILLIGEVPADWPDDTWIRAEGRFALRDDQGKPMPTLELSGATRTAKPRQPYLY